MYEKNYSDISIWPIVTRLLMIIVNYKVNSNSIFPHTHAKNLGIIFDLCIFYYVYSINPWANLICSPFKINLWIHLLFTTLTTNALVQATALSPRLWQNFLREYFPCFYPWPTESLLSSHMILWWHKSDVYSKSGLYSKSFSGSQLRVKVFPMAYQLLYNGSRWTLGPPLLTVSLLLTLFQLNYLLYCF